MGAKNLSIDSISEFRAKLSRSTEEIVKNKSKTIITIHGKPRVIVMALDSYEDEIEHINPKEWKLIKQAEGEYKKKDYSTLDEVLEKLNFEL